MNETGGHTSIPRHRRPRIVVARSKVTPSHTRGTSAEQMGPISASRRWSSERRVVLAVGLAVALLLAIGLYAWQTGSSLENLSALGYPGVFLIMLLSGASTFFPVGGQAAIMAAGSLWNPILVGLAAGLGNATGELLGYGAGRIGASALEGRALPKWWFLLRGWLLRYGFFAILALALIPNPVFDALGLLAGSLGYPVRRFWLACLLGNSVKYVGVAYLGDAVSWLLN